jgi:hypothetical protein
VKFSTSRERGKLRVSGRNPSAKQGAKQLGPTFEHKYSGTFHMSDDLGVCLYILVNCLYVHVGLHLLSSISVNAPVLFQSHVAITRDSIQLSAGHILKFVAHNKFVLNYFVNSNLHHLMSIHRQQPVPPKSNCRYNTHLYMCDDSPSVNILLKHKPSYASVSVHEVDNYYSLHS